MCGGREVLNELQGPSAELRARIPGVYGGFVQLHQAAMADGELGSHTKELIALACAVLKRCDGCIANHSRALARAKATEQEVAEAIGVAILMDGGPATVYGPRALQAFREFANIS